MQSRLEDDGEKVGGDVHMLYTQVGIGMNVCYEYKYLAVKHQRWRGVILGIAGETRLSTVGMCLNVVAAG